MSLPLAAVRVPSTQLGSVTFVSRVLDAGASVSEAMTLARHSDPRLTTRTYARVDLHSLGRVLEDMPRFATSDDGPTAERMRATGTDGRTGTASDHGDPHHRPHQSQRKAELRSAHRRDADSEHGNDGGCENLWNHARCASLGTTARASARKATSGI
jgi:hypothetical protein